MADLRIVDVDTILSKWHDLLRKRRPNFPCQTFTGFMRNNSQELVQCKECKNRQNPEECPMCFTEVVDVVGGRMYKFTDLTRNDGFCCMGAKMDGGENNAHNY